MYMHTNVNFKYFLTFGAFSVSNACYASVAERIFCVKVSSTMRGRGRHERARQPEEIVYVRFLQINAAGATSEKGTALLAATRTTHMQW